MQHLIIVGIAWVLAQSMKHVFRLFGRNRRVFHNNPRSPLLLSGGMPSAHAASVSALTVSVGCYDGLNSSIFAVAVLFSVIVAYDAVMVRHSSGMQGDLLNRVIDKSFPEMKQIKVAHGHTVVEVLAGAVIGVAVACVVIFATK